MIKRGLPSWRLYQIFVPWPDVILTKCSGCKTIYGYCFPRVMFSRNVPGKARGTQRWRLLRFSYGQRSRQKREYSLAHFYSNIPFLNYSIMFTSKVVKTISTNKHCLCVNCALLRLQNSQQWAFVRHNHIVYRFKEGGKQSSHRLWC